MAESARTNPAVLAQRIDDCQGREAEHRRENREEHDDLFGRVRALEVAVAQMAVRMAIAAAIGAAVGSAALGYVMSLIGKG